MKITLTCIALSFAATAQAQFQSSQLQQFPMVKNLPPHVARAAALGPEMVMQRQLRGARTSKTSAVPFRLSGWSRTDLDMNIILDSARHAYSGNRGTQFADESDNLFGGNSWSASQSDRFTLIRAQGQGDNVEILNQYDAADRNVERIVRSGGWASKSISTYDAAGLISTVEQSDSDATQGWVPGQISYHRHNAAKLRTLDSAVSLSTGAPLTVVRYHYDAGGRLDTLDNLSWNGSGYDRIYLSAITYDAAGRQRSITNYLSNSGPQLQPAQRIEFSYTANGMLSESVSAAYQNGAWTPNGRDTMGYTGTKALYTYFRSDSRDAGAKRWKPIRETVYTLNAAGRWDTEIAGSIDNRGDLAPFTKTSIAYNADGLITRTTTFAYNRTTAAYGANPFKGERFYYNQEQATGVDRAIADSAISMYPNPATETVNLESTDADVTGLVLLGSSGQRLPVPVQPGRRQRIDVSRLPSGVYLLQVWLKGHTAPLAIRFVKR